MRFCFLLKMHYGFPFFLQTFENNSSPKLARYDSTCRPKSTEDEEKIPLDNDEELEGNLTCGICQVRTIRNSMVLGRVLVEDASSTESITSRRWCS